MSALRESARGADCMIRIPGICSFNNEETVLAHVNGAGMGIKADDTEASFACYPCHCAVDSKPTVRHSFTTADIKLMFLQGCVRTRDYWRENGYINKYR
jgi:uncharacterized CHY-type Zn-finger protein